MAIPSEYQFLFGKTEIVNGSKKYPLTEWIDAGKRISDPTEFVDAGNDEEEYDQRCLRVVFTRGIGNFTWEKIKEVMQLSISGMKARTIPADNDSDANQVIDTAYSFLHPSLHSITKITPIKANSNTKLRLSIQTQRQHSDLVLQACGMAQGRLAILQARQEWGALDLRKKLFVALHCSASIVDVSNFVNNLVDQQ